MYVDGKVEQTKLCTENLKGNGNDIFHWKIPYPTTSFNPSERAKVRLQHPQTVARGKLAK